MRKKLIIISFSSLILIVLLVQLFFVFRDHNQLRKDLVQLSDKLESLQKENIDLKSEIEYFSYPENLEKELKQKLNYKRAGEKMIIVVPQ